MLAKAFRFHGHGSLRFLYTNGKQVRSKQLSLKYVQNPRRQNNRFGVVVSKKVTKKAPVRNKIRRRIYEAMQTEWQNLSSPHDIVVTVFDEHIAALEFTQLQAQLKALLQKANLYKH